MMKNMEGYGWCKTTVRKLFAICLIVGIVSVLCYLTISTRGRNEHTFKTTWSENNVKSIGSPSENRNSASNSYKDLMAAAVKLFYQGYLNENTTDLVSEPPKIIQKASAGAESQHHIKLTSSPNLSDLVNVSQVKTRALETLSRPPGLVPIRSNRWQEERLSQDSYAWTCKDALQAEKKRNNVTRMMCRDIFENIVETCSHCPTSRPLGNFFFQDTEKEELRSEYREANLAFVHIPKSAGTSVEGLLKSYLKDVRQPCADCANTKRVQVAHCIQFHEAILYHDAVNRTFWFSKRTFGLHRFIADTRPFFYFLWFRDPVERVVSTYYYLKRFKPHKHPLTRRFILNSRNLEHFLSFEEPFPDFDNFNVRLLQLGEFPNIDAFFEECCGAYEGREDTFLPPIKKEHYEVAKRNLEQYVGFIGLLEDFKTSQDMLCDILGIPKLKRTIRINSNLHRRNLTEFEKKEIEKRNVWDIKLYEHAKTIYYQQKEKYEKIKNIL